MAHRRQHWGPFDTARAMDSETAHLRIHPIHPDTDFPRMVLAPQPKRPIWLLENHPSIFAHCYGEFHLSILTCLWPEPRLCAYWASDLDVSAAGLPCSRPIRLLWLHASRTEVQARQASPVQPRCPCGSRQGYCARCRVRRCSRSRRRWPCAANRDFWRR